MTSSANLLPAKRILVIRYRFIGDTILTVPLLRNLRLAYPEATIDVLVGPESGTILQGCPYVDDLIEFDTTRFHKYDRGVGKPKSFWSYALALRKRSYDMVLVLKRSWSSGLLAWLTGARWRIGYSTEGRHAFLTHHVPWNRRIHEVESTLDVLRAVNVPVLDDRLEAWVTEEEQQAVSSLVPELKNQRKRILIHASAAHPDKMYPLEYWSSVLRELDKLWPTQFYFTGAKKDWELYEGLMNLSAVTGVNLAGKLTLRQSLALYSQMHMAVCVDSGPAHMAAAAGCPTLAIFGPSDPGRWRPWGRNCAFVSVSAACQSDCLKHKNCPASLCLAKLEPNSVMAACQPFFDQWHLESIRAD